MFSPKFLLWTNWDLTIMFSSVEASEILGGTPSGFGLIAKRSCHVRSG